LLECFFDSIFDLVPEYFSYRGIFSEHLKACDQLFGLINELPFSREAMDALAKYEPKGYHNFLISEANKPIIGKSNSRVSKVNKSSKPERSSEVIIPYSFAFKLVERYSRRKLPSKKPIGNKNFSFTIKNI
jgi:hypothetical protein